MNLPKSYLLKLIAWLFSSLTAIDLMILFGVGLVVAWIVSGWYERSDRGLKLLKEISDKLSNK